MAGGSLGGRQCRGRIISDINVTPLVDIMLVLLIIFMVTTTTMVLDALEVKLPEAASGGKTKTTLLSLVLTDKGEVRLNGAPTTDAQIRAYIDKQTREGKKMEAIIAADRDARHGEVVRLIDLVRNAGVTKFAINVIKKE